MRLLALLVMLPVLLRAQSLDPAGYHHPRNGLAQCHRVFKEQKFGRVAFMGGSITEHGAWRDKICEYLRQRYPDTKFEFINAGISSTGSTPGAFRLSQDVLSHGRIDLFFEEAAVNDPTNGFTGKYQVRGMEGVIRQALASNPAMDIVMLHFVDPEKMTDYDQGIIPEVIRNHEAVAEHYGVNSIDLAKEVTERIRDREFNWKDDFKDLHPSPFGHEVYARSIRSFLDKAFAEAADGKTDKRRKRLPRPLDPFHYAAGRYVPVTEARDMRGFRHIDNWQPTDGYPTRKQYVGIPAMVADSAGASFTFRFRGRAVGFCLDAGPDAGIIEYEIDGQWRGRRDLFTKWSHMLHLPWYILLEDELPEGDHVLTLRVAAEKNAASKGHTLRVLHILVNGPS
jgi:sialidase-1